MVKICWIIFHSTLTTKLHRFYNKFSLFSQILGNRSSHRTQNESLNNAASSQPQLDGRRSWRTWRDGYRQGHGQVQRVSSRGTHSLSMKMGRKELFGDPPTLKQFSYFAYPLQFRFCWIIEPGRVCKIILIPRLILILIPILIPRLILILLGASQFTPNICLRQMLERNLKR